MSTRKCCWMHGETTFLQLPGTAILSAIVGVSKAAGIPILEAVHVCGLQTVLKGLLQPGPRVQAAYREKPRQLDDPGLQVLLLQASAAAEGEGAEIGGDERSVYVCVCCNAPAGRAFPDR